MVPPPLHPLLRLPAGIKGEGIIRVPLHGKVVMQIR